MSSFNFLYQNCTRLFLLVIIISILPFYSTIAALAPDSYNTILDTRGTARGRPSCRLIAIGDIHGDLHHAQQALLKAGVITLVHSSDGKATGATDHNNQYKWSLGCGTLIQVGDIVDRGPSVLSALEFFKDLGEMARAEGGKVVRLLGNHETILMKGNPKYINHVEVERIGLKAYMAMFAPGGKWRKEMSRFSVAAMYDGTVFVHAGLRPSHASLGIRYLNKLAQIQINNNLWDEGLFLDDGPVWNRITISDAIANECAELELSLSLLGAKRMVVGHTIQPNNRVVSYCGGKLIAIDVGMSEVMGGVRAASVEFMKGGEIRVYYVEFPRVRRDINNNINFHNIDDNNVAD